MQKKTIRDLIPVMVANPLVPYKVINELGRVASAKYNAATRYIYIKYDTRNSWIRLYVDDYDKWTEFKAIDKQIPVGQIFRVQSRINPKEWCNVMVCNIANTLKLIVVHIGEQSTRFKIGFEAIKSTSFMFRDETEIKVAEIDNIFNRQNELEWCNDL